MESLKIIPKKIRKAITAGLAPEPFAGRLLYGLRARKVLLLNNATLTSAQQNVLAVYAISNLRKATGFFTAFFPWLIYVVYQEMNPPISQSNGLS